MNKIKIVKLLSFCAALCASAAIGTYATSAKAESESSPYDYVTLETGASVRYAESADGMGLSYRLKMPEAQYNLIPEADETIFGIYFAPQDYYAVHPFNTVEEITQYYTVNADPETGKARLYDFQGTMGSSDGENVYFRGSLVGVLEQNLTRDFRAVGYVKYKVDGEYTYKFIQSDKAEDNIRSMAYVAEKAIVDNTTKMNADGVSAAEKADLEAKNVKLQEYYISKVGDPFGDEAEHGSAVTVYNCTKKTLVLPQVSAIEAAKTNTYWKDKYTQYTYTWALKNAAGESVVVKDGDSLADLQGDYTLVCTASKGDFSKEIYAQSYKITDEIEGIKITLNGAAYVNGKENNAATIVFNGDDYVAGESYTFTVTAADGYVVKSVTVNGVAVTEENGVYTFVFNGNNEIAVKTAATGKVTLGNIANANVTVENNADLQHVYESGDAVNFTVEAESDYYEIVAVKVNGETLTAADGKYTRVFGEDGRFEITAETKIVKTDVTLTLGYWNGGAIDAGRVSLKGAQITFTNKVDESAKYTVTVGENNAVPAITGMKPGKYTVTTTAMNGKLKGLDFTCADTAISLNATLKLDLANDINNNGSYKAELGSDFAVNSIKSDGGNRPVGNLVLSGLNLQGEVWFGATVKLSGAGHSLDWGAMIGLYIGTATGNSWVEIGNPQDVSGAKDGDGGVKCYKGNGYSSGGYVMNAAEKALLTGNGIRVAVCRTAEGALEVYFVIDGQLNKVATFTDGAIGADAIASFGVRLNSLYTGSVEAEKGWIHNVDYAATAKELLGEELGSVEIKLNGAAYESGNADNAATIEVNESEYVLGKSYTFTVTAASGYTVKSVTVNGETVTEENGVYTFVFNGKIEIAVTAVELGKVTIGKVNGATISVADNADLQHEYQSGDTVTFTVSPVSDYYEIVAVKVNGETLTAIDGRYTRVFGEDGRFEITVETKVVKADVTVSLGYENGSAIDASKVSLKGAQITLTNKADESAEYTVTVGENNVIPEIAGMKLGTYAVTTTAMNGKLKAADVEIASEAVKANVTLKLLLTNSVKNNYKAELGAGFSIDNIAGVRAEGNILMNGLNLQGEVWFGALVKISGAGASLNYGSIIGFSIGDCTIEFGHAQNINGATVGNGGIQYYDKNGYKKSGYVMTEAENALLKGDGLRVAVCRTAEGALKVYFVIDGQLKEIVTFADNAVGTEAITSFGVRMNAVYTGNAENKELWIHNVDYAATAKDLLGDELTSD